MADEMAMRLLQATRDQLHEKPTREVQPFEIAQKAGLNPYSREYERGVRYLLDHGYIEHYPNEAVTELGFYRLRIRDWKKFLATPNRRLPLSTVTEDKSMDASPRVTVRRWRLLTASRRFFSKGWPAPPASR